MYFNNPFRDCDCNKHIRPMLYGHYPQYQYYGAGSSGGGFLPQQNNCCTYQDAYGNQASFCFDYPCPIATPTGLTLVNSAKMYCTAGDQCVPPIDTYFQSKRPNYGSFY